MTPRCKFVHNLPCEQVSERITELEDENAELRAERDYLLMNSNPTATELRRVRSAWKKDRDENAKLREQVTRLQADWESERDYADQMEVKEKRAVAENAKLRELVRKWYPYALKRVGRDALEQWGQMEVVRELGIEVGE